MFRNKASYLLIFLITCISCNNVTVKHTDYIKIYDIDYSENDLFNLADYIEVDTVFSLNLPKNEVLGMAQNCIFIKDKIIYQDFNQHIVFVFDKLGKYLYKIDKIGNGPGEYDRIYDIRVTHDESKIMINNGFKILLYDINNGEYLYTENFINDNNYAFTPICINTSKDTYYCWSSASEYSLYKWENNHFTGIKKRNGRQLITKKFIKNYNNIITLPDYGEYGIDYLNGTKMYYLNFGSYSLPEKMIPQTIKQFEEIEQSAYFKAVVDAYETERKLFISVVGPKSMYYYICIDKDTDKILKGYSPNATGLAIMHADNDFFYALFYPSFASDQSNIMNKIHKYNNAEDEPFVVKFRM